MIKPSSQSKNLKALLPGDLVTYIEGDSWVFISSKGKQRKSPPVGIVISTFDEVGIKVMWVTGELTMEWRSQLQLYDEYILSSQKGKEDVQEEP